LEADGQIVYNSTGDADTLIVECALQFARQGRELSVVADDTDVLVLLMYHWNQNMADLYFHSVVKRSKKCLKVWKVQDLVTKVRKVVTFHLLFIHVWSGCETTSATHGHGKTSLLKEIKQSEELQISLLMTDPEATEEHIGKAGIWLYVVLYGGRADDYLNSLWYAKYIEMVSTSKTSSFHLQKEQHIFTVCGFTCKSYFGLTAVLSDLDAATESLLKFVRCKYKLFARNPCGNNSCSCRKHGH